MSIEEIRCNLTSRWRKNAFLDQPFAKFDAILVVYVQQGDSDAADRRQADQVGTSPLEMLGPFVPAGIEQRRNLTCLRISTGEIRSFKRVTEGAKTRRTKLTPIDPRLIVR
jgi:hypothetical protein